MSVTSLNAASNDSGAAGVPWLSHGIVVGVDGSDASIEALRCALRLGDLAGCPVRAIAVWQPVPFGSWTTPLSRPAEDAASVLIDAVGSACGDQVPEWFTATTRQGTAADVLNEESKVADLLIVGTRGRGKVKGLLLGSVSSSCLGNATCPVLVVNAALVN
jgi:nucleotide-binding universal stress UspA family protein